MTAEIAIYPKLTITVDGVTLIDQAFLIFVRRLSAPFCGGPEEITCHFRVAATLASSLAQSLNAFMPQVSRHQWVFDISDPTLHVCHAGYLKTWSIFNNAEDSSEVHLTIELV